MKWVKSDPEMNRLTDRHEHLPTAKVNKLIKYLDSPFKISLQINQF